MKKKTVSQTWLSLIVVVAVAWIGLAIFGRFDLRFDERRLSEMATAQLAKRADANGYMQVKRAGKVRVTDLAISVGEKDMGIAFEMEGIQLMQKYRLSASAVGVPEYRDQAFYFKASDIQIREFQLGDGKLAERIKTFADNYVDGDRKRAALIKAAPKIAEWVKEHAEYGAVRTLERLPVYKVGNNFPGLIIKSSLVSGSLRVENGHLVATVSVLQFTYTMMIVGAIGIAAAVMVIGLLRGGGGAGVGLLSIFV